MRTSTVLGCRCVPSISEITFATLSPRTAEQFSWFPVAQNVMCNVPSRQRQLFTTKASYDPLARRPNQICDPYGQGGKPLSREDAQGLLAAVEKDWSLVPEDSPTLLVRDFYHKDFMEGSKFVAKIAAVAHMNNHYPSIYLERRLLPKSWQVTTRVKCSTPTLRGLSYNDFHIAMVKRMIFLKICVCLLLFTDFLTAFLSLLMWR